MKLSPLRLFLVALILGLGMSGPEISTAGEIRRFDLEIRDRRVQRDDNVLKVRKGDRVILNWTTDEQVALHLHGYDIEFDAAPGQSVEREFEAHATGRFPVTSHGFGGEHGGHHTLLYLEVHPD